MIVALIFAQVWGVVQVIVLGSLARTARSRTVFAAMGAGLYVCAPLAVLVEVSWIRPSAWLTGTSMAAMVATAAYSVDPFIEECVKLLPLVLLLLVPRIRRQWALTDCVLTGAAVGSGFGLAEALYRYGASPQQAQGNEIGWTIAGVGLPTVPSVSTSLSSWLPMGAAPLGAIRSSMSFPVNLHLAWSAIGGLAVGLILLQPGRTARLTGLGLLLYVGLDHAAYNSGGAAFGVPFAGVRTLLGLMVLAAIVAAWWLDQRPLVANDEALLLIKERSVSWRPAGTLLAAIGCLPRSLPRVSEFARLRRIYKRTMAVPPSQEQEALRAAIIDARDRIDVMQPEVAQWASIVPRRGALMGALRRPAIAARLALLLPPILWFVVGGSPQTAIVQTWMMGPVTWKAMLVLSVVTQGWLAWQVLIALRAWSKSAARPMRDDTAAFALRMACGIGALSLGGFALVRAFAGLSPRVGLLSAHAVDAFDSATGPVAVDLANVGMLSPVNASEYDPSAGGLSESPTERGPGPWSEGYNLGDPNADGGASHDPSEYDPSAGGRSESPTERGPGPWSEGYNFGDPNADGGASHDPSEYDPSAGGRSEPPVASHDGAPETPPEESFIDELQHQREERVEVVVEKALELHEVIESAETGSFAPIIVLKSVLKKAVTGQTDDEA